MKARFLFQVGLCCGLLLSVVVVAGRLGDRLGIPVLDLGGLQAASLSAEIRPVLRRLDAPLRLSYFVSRRSDMPSHFRRLEDEVRTLLGALRAVAPDKVHYRVLYPESSGEPGIAYAARQGAAAFGVEDVRHDQHAERMIWSSLVLEYGDRRPVVIPRIHPEHIQQLEELVRGHVLAMQHPPRPVFAVAASADTDGLQQALAEYGDVKVVDLARNPRIPAVTDVLFWIQPRVATPEHQRALAAYVASGRSAIIAGSTYSVEYHVREGEAAVVARSHGTALADVLRPLGITPVADLLLDRSGPLHFAGSDGSVRSMETPLQLLCLPAQCDFRALAAPARGGLSFLGASALELDPGRIRQAGYRASIVATTTGAARALPVPHAALAVTALDGGQRVGRRNLMVMLTSVDPRAGRILVMGSPAPFLDGIFEQPDYAHAGFLRTLVQTFAGTEALVQARAASPQPSRLPPMGQAQRLVWRLVAVAAIPLLCLGLGLRHVRQDSGQGARRRGLRLAGWLVSGGLVLGGTGYVVGVTDGWQWDWTRDRLNQPSPLLLQELQARAGTLEVDLLLSPRAHLPARLKNLESRLRSILSAGGVDLTVIHPEYSSPGERERLAAEGVATLPVEKVRHDTVLTHQIWSALRLRHEGRSTVIPRLDERALRHLDFLLAAAVWRLEHETAPRVALIAEPRRLSPAEAHEDYHRRNLAPPSGADIYSQVKHLLVDYGYEVVYVDSRNPQFGFDVDLVLWLQPRRDSTPITDYLAQHLHRGASALVAMQHFNIQQRQYRGAGFQTVYWPQPQFQDLDPYLQHLGLQQVREVLMDRTQGHALLETQVNRAAVRDYDFQKVALPFLIRGVAAHYCPASPVTRRLGDMLFLWANRFTLDPGRMAQIGVQADTLITTSPQAWSYQWEGGWLPPESFSPSELLGPQPLVVQISGRFPAFSYERDEVGRTQWSVQPGPVDNTGKLMLIGCAEIFTDEYLFAPGFDHDQLLLNSTAALTYGPELAALQARSTAPQGFPYLPAGHKAGWRLFAIGAGPLVFGFVSVIRQPVRRRGT